MKACVIGCGHAGKRFIAILKELGVEVCGFDSNRAAVEQSGVEFSRGGDANAWIICTPPETHLFYVWRGLQEGKHIFVEKPVSDSFNGVSEVRDLMEANPGLVVMVGHNLRFLSNLRCIKNQIEKGMIKPQYARAFFSYYLPLWHPKEDYRDSYIRDCGFLLDASVHEIDYLRWLFGDVTAVSCTTDRITKLEINPDSFDMQLRFKSGMLADIHMDLASKKYKRYLLLHDKSPHVRTYPLPASRITSTYRREMRHFLDCIAKGRQPLVTFDDGVKAMEVALVAQLAASKRSWIRM